jgi:glycosyltransferase involved in cell wall biosynthesis
VSHRGRSRPRLLVLTQHYRPEPNFITADVAEGLSDTFAVTVVTAHPHYPEGRFHAGVRPWWPSRTIEGGVTVWRLPMVPYRGRSHFGRMVSYLSFALAAAVWAPLVSPAPHGVWVYHGPFTAGIAAAWFRLIGSRIVFTCADLWPESFLAAQVARPGLMMRLMFAYSRAVNRVAHLLICSTRGTLRRYAKDGIPESRLCYVPVWVEGIPPVPPAPNQKSTAANVVYAGNLGPAQGLDTVISAAAALCHRGVPIRFDIYGTGASEAELRRQAAESGATNVVFHGRVPPPAAFERAAEATAQLVCLRSTPLFAMTIPSKLSFSFAAGTPILYGLVGESAELVGESGGGIAFDANDPSSLVDAVNTLLALPEAALAAKRAQLRRYYEEHFQRSKLLDEYRGAFSRLILTPLASGGPNRQPDDAEAGRV